MQAVKRCHARDCRTPGLQVRKVELRLDGIGCIVVTDARPPSGAAGKNYRPLIGHTPRKQRQELKS